MKEVVRGCEDGSMNRYSFFTQQVRQAEVKLTEAIATIQCLAAYQDRSRSGYNAVQCTLTN